MLVGYARVSSQDQDLTAQIAELTAAGCAKIYSEKVSGAQSYNRKELQKVLNKLQEGDVLVISRLDRLARSTRDLLNILDSVSQKGAAFRSLHDPWIDTSTPHGRLIITVLSGLAEFERELIRARTSDGRRRALEKGVRFGRPLKLNSHQRREALERIAAGESQTDIAKTYAVDPSTISRLVTASATV